jgi:hypothetical protein
MRSCPQRQILLLELRSGRDVKLRPATKSKMPGFPTQIVGTPTNRGKARRYGEKGAASEGGRDRAKNGGVKPPCRERGLRPRGTMYRAPTT